MELVLVDDDAALDRALAGCELALVFFSGRQCAVCISFEKMLKAICKGYSSICCIKAYSDNAPGHIKQLGIMGVPALVGYVNGKPVMAASGLLQAPTINMFIISLIRRGQGRLCAEDLG